MKKKWLSACLALMTAGTLAFANGTADTAEKKGAGKTTIIYYAWDDPSIKPIVDAYNKAQDKIFVDARYIPAPDYETKITTLLTAKAEMDCFNEKSQFALFNHYENGFVEPLDSYLKNSKTDHSAIDNYKTAITYDGKILAYPWRGASYYTYYNKKLFKNAGIPTPDTYVKNGTWTWEKFAEVSKKLASGDGNVYGSSVYFWGNNNLFLEAQAQKPIISANGKIDFDGNILKWFQMRKDLENAKAIWPLVDMKVTKTHYSKQFYDGRTAMLLIGEWFPGYMVSGRDKNLLKDYTWTDWGVTRLPCDNTVYVTMGTPTSNELVTYGKHKTEAFEFMSWMGGQGGAMICAANGLLPPVVTPEVENVLSGNFPDKQSLTYFTEKKIIYPLLMSKYGTPVDNLTSSIIEDYLLGKISDADFNKQYTAKLQEIIDNAN